jgi:hypothetical protein
MKRPSLFIIALLILGISAQAQTWKRYIPKNQRVKAVKPGVKVSGFGLSSTGQTAMCFWITDPVAAAFVSETIDKERLSDQEADERFNALRPGDKYLFLIDVSRLGITGRTSAKSLADPLAKNEIFLQRKEDNQQFSKGVIQEHNFNLSIGGILGGSELRSTYFVAFPKQTRNNTDLIKSLDDKIEIQFVVSLAN